MPGTSVPQRPSPEELRRYGVGKPVSSGHGLRWSEQLAFLLAHQVEPVYAGVFADPTFGTTSVVVPYARSPYVRALYCCAELSHDDPGDNGKLAVTLSGATWIGGNNPLEGVNDIPVPPSNRRLPEVWEGFLDVSGLTAGTITPITATWTPTTGSAGIYRLHYAEVPLLDASPGASASLEAGVNASWPNPPNLLVDSASGVANTGHGFPRVYDQLGKARAGMKRHWTVAVTEDTDYAWTRSAADGAGVFGALTWRPLAGGYEPKWRIRARRLYGTATANAYTLYVRYRMLNVGETATLRATINGANTDTALANSTSFTSATAAVTVPCSTTDQESEVTFRASVNGTLYVSTLALVENEG